MTSSIASLRVEGLLCCERGGSLRVLLVKPKPRLATIRGLQRFTFLEPLELGYLAAAVPPAHEVRAVDLRLARNERRALERALAAQRPDVVGFSGYSHDASAIRALARLTRLHIPRATIVVGGHHATVAWSDYESDGIDAIVRGEGTAAFRQLIEAVAAGEPLHGVASVVVPGTTLGKLSGFPEFPDPSTLPLPRRDLWDYRNYFTVWACEGAARWQPLFPPTAIVRTSFGCSMSCNFCIVPLIYGGRHMPRPVESVVDELASLPADHVYFSDDENFIDEDFAWALAEAIERRGVRKRYMAWARATTVNRSPELLRRWRQVGLDLVFVGFEYPTDRELRLAQKGGTVAGNDRAHATLRKLGIAVHGSFMVRPEYSEDDFARLREYVQRIPPIQCSFTVCTPSPGTPGYESIRRDSWAPNPYDLHDCMHPLERTALPLKSFCALFARQVEEAGRRNPLRTEPRPVPPLDLLRAIAAERRYVRAFRTMYRDYPREIWA